MLTLYNSETIFERQIRILNEFGIKEIIVTTGPYENMLKDNRNKYYDIVFRFIYNKEYKTTNYIVFMNNTYNCLEDGILLLYDDLVFNKN